ncbi:MAG: putative ABC transporter permease [Bariatricus sp.]|nr:putative ABC transporter permease [Bariatricus sp.]
MWWNRVIFGVGSYELVMWFLTYGMLGWLVESIYMSFCNKKLTNRGFGRGPFCPIYGVGALTVFFLLRPYSENRVLLFFMGSFFATILEYLTALLMQKVFGEVWWDYNEKPFNYKGIICLESSIAWGFYTLFLFMFLQNTVEEIVALIPLYVGRVAGSVLITVFGMDFLSSFYNVKKDDMPECVTGPIERIKENIRNFI